MAMVETDGRDGFFKLLMPEFNNDLFLSDPMFTYCSSLTLLAEANVGER
jgi:hypothetical protein